MPILAPTEIILKDYKSGDMTWEKYESNYIDLIKSRDIMSNLNGINLDHSCLLCSEKTPDNCHRRLAAEILKNSFNINKIIHL